jgi:glycosyltransferase involved in cell wall biosynthesis
MPRLAIVASHPVQYQAPWFRALAGAADVHVFYCHRQTADDQARAGFGAPFEWDVPLLDGYAHTWLRNVAATPDVSTFRGCDTPEIRDRLTTGGFDACIVNGWYLKSYLQAIRACWSIGLPVLVRGDSRLHRRGAAIKSAVKFVPYRWFLRRIDAHLYVGGENRALLMHYGVPADRLFFAPHFVDNEHFAAGAEAARKSGAVQALRREWEAYADATVFLFVGKLVAHKRPRDFVAAIARLAEHGVNARGVIVGAGALESELTAEVRARKLPVHFAGFQNQRALPAFYAAADCLVVPSESETWGLVVNEAFAAGTPAVVSDEVGCAADLLAGGDTGFTFRVGDVDHLAARLLQFGREPWDVRREQRLAARKTVARYSREAAAAGTLEAVAAVSRHRRGAAIA